jgi:hypothetical protein
VSRRAVHPHSISRLTPARSVASKNEPSTPSDVPGGHAAFLGLPPLGALGQMGAQVGRQVGGGPRVPRAIEPEAR